MFREINITSQGTIGINLCFIVSLKKESCIPQFDHAIFRNSYKDIITSKESISHAIQVTLQLALKVYMNKYWEFKLNLPFELNYLLSVWFVGLCK